MPLFASANRPGLRWMAPVNAPFSCPNSSLSASAAGMAPQFTFTITASRRRLRVWMARAMSSLPVPVSPSTSTVESVAATISMSRNTRCIDVGAADDLAEVALRLQLLLQVDVPPFELLGVPLDELAQPDLFGDVALDPEVPGDASGIVVEADVVALDPDRRPVGAAFVGLDVQPAAVEELAPHPPSVCEVVPEQIGRRGPEELLARDAVLGQHRVVDLGHALVGKHVVERGLLVHAHVPADRLVEHHEEEAVERLREEELEVSSIISPGGKGSCPSAWARAPRTGVLPYGLYCRGLQHKVELGDHERRVHPERPCHFVTGSVFVEVDDQ